MKNLRKCTMLGLLLFLLAITTSACGSGGSESCDFFGYPNLNETKKLTLSKYKFILDVGTTDNVIAYVNNEDKTNEVTFNPIKEEFKKNTIATVEKGLINAITPGTSIVQVSYEGTDSVTFTVTVNDPTLPNLELAKNQIDYVIGEDTLDIEQILVMLNGSNVTSAAEYTSSDPSVATVDENGKITFVGEGTVNIIVHMEGANDAVLTVTVKKPELTLSQNIFLIELGETDSVNIKLRDDEKTNEAKYTVSDPSVATIDENGNITALKEGETVITVQVEGAQDAEITVVVPHQPAVYTEAFNILLGNEDKLDILLRGENVTDQCELNIDNQNQQDIITLDEFGNMKGIAVGEVTITTSCNGDDITIPVKVYDELTTTATNANDEPITVKTKILSEDEANKIKIILQDTSTIQNKDDVQKVIVIDNIDDLSNLDIDIDLEDGTTVAIVHRMEDGTLKYLSTETVQDKKIIKNEINSNEIKEVLLNILLGNTKDIEIDDYEIVENNGIITLNNSSIKGDKVGTAIIKTTADGQEIIIKVNVYDTLPTTATSSNGGGINVNSKILPADDADIIKTLLYDTGNIPSKDSVQKVVVVDNINDLSNLNIDIDLANGTSVALVHIESDGTVKYISTETVQNKKITKTGITASSIKEVIYNMLLGSTAQFEIENYTITSNNNIINLSNQTITGIGVGTATISAPYNGGTIRAKVNVYNAITANGGLTTVPLTQLTGTTATGIQEGLINTGTTNNPPSTIIEIGGAQLPPNIAYIVPTLTSNPGGSVVIVEPTPGSTTGGHTLVTITNPTWTTCGGSPWYPTSPIPVSSPTGTELTTGNGVPVPVPTLAPGFYGSNNNLIKGLDDTYYYNGWIDYINGVNDAHYYSNDTRNAYGYFYVWESVYANSSDSNDSYDAPWTIDDYENGIDYFLTLFHMIDTKWSSADKNNITKFVLPKDLVHLGNNWFALCGDMGSKINTIVFPATYAPTYNASYRSDHISTSWINEQHFGELFATSNLSLNNIEIDSDNPYYTSVDGVVYSKDMKTLYYCPNNKTQLVIPNTVTEIDSYAFFGNKCTSVGPVGSGADIQIPNSVKTIGDYCFASTKNLVWLELPDGLQEIGYAFAGIYINPVNRTEFETGSSFNFNLNQINYNQTTNIRNYYSALKSVYIPSSATNNLGNSLALFRAEVHFYFEEALYDTEDNFITNGPYDSYNLLHSGVSRSNYEANCRNGGQPNY